MNEPDGETEMNVNNHLACVASVSQNVREGNEIKRECKKKIYAKETRLGGSAKNM